jgi:S1-C subfamily serine protease
MKTHLIHTAALIMLVLGLGSNSYADWQPLGKFDNNVEIFVDNQNITLSNGLVWTKVKYEKEAGLLMKLVSNIKTEIHTLAINCGAQTVAAAEVIQFGHSGQVINHETSPVSQLQFKPIGAQGTVSSAVAEMACRVAYQQSLEPYLSAQEEKKDDWVALSKSPTGVVFSVFAPSVSSVSDSIVTFIMRANFPDVQYTDAGDKYVEHRERVFVDCSKNLYSFDIAELYAPDRSIVSQTQLAEKDVVVKKIGDQPHIKGIVEVVCDAALGGESSSDAEASPKYGMGSAWLLNEGVLVTAAHVLHGAKKVIIKQRDGKLTEVTVLAADIPNDVALVKTLDGSLNEPGLPLATQTARIGSRIFAIGYPLADQLGLKLQATSGDISANSGSDGDFRFYQVSSPIQTGNSGGPVLNSQGEVVGIVIEKMQLAGNELVQNVNFVLKSAYVNAFVQGAGQTSTAKRPALYRTPEDLVEHASKFVYPIFAIQ